MIAERPLLAVHGLVTRIDGDDGEIFPSRDISLELGPGEAVGLVGESGSGKSITARAMIGLLQPPGTIEAGTLTWNGDDLVRMPRNRLRALRAREIALATQDSRTMLDPLRTVGDQLTRIHRRQTGAKRSAAHAAAIEVMHRVGIAYPESRLGDYPHQLAAGTRQRVLIAMALICRPRLLIADEAITGLDSTAQAEFLALFAEFRREHGMAVLLITHDIALAARLCERILVMYGGRIVESGPTDAVLATPHHPYTRALLGSVVHGTWRDGPLPTVRGEPQKLAELPAGCPFQARCPDAESACLGLQSLRLVAAEHRAACWRAAVAAASRPRR